jgi:hypothetical protein
MELPEPDPIAADNRRRRRRTLIPEEAACVLCGLSDADVLFEDDHPLGQRAVDTVRIWLCLNCHRRQGSARHDHQAGSPAGRPTGPISLLERLARALRSLGVFAHSLGHALFGFAAQLLAMEVGLDEFAPGWRAQVWAS